MKKLQHNINVHRQSAVIAGISLLIMTIAAFFSYGYIHSSLIINDNSIETLNKIQASAGLFNAEILGWLVIIITDILVSWAFYIYLKPIHQEFSLLAAWLRLIYTAILAIALSNLIQVSYLMGHSGELFSLSNDNLASQVMIHVRSFESVWSFGLIVFGLHLLIVCLVVSKSAAIPKPISILLGIAGASYVLIHLLDGFVPQLENVTSLLEMILSIPMMVGELGFGIWLLIKGGKTPRLD